MWAEGKPGLAHILPSGLCGGRSLLCGNVHSRRAAVSCPCRIHASPQVSDGWVTMNDGREVEGTALRKETCFPADDEGDFMVSI